MDFLTLNFGQLLHLLDNELKNIIGNFEKQKKHIISAQYGIVFNQTCLNDREELYPAYSNIYIFIYQPVKGQYQAMKVPHRYYRHHYSYTVPHRYYCHHYSYTAPHRYYRHYYFYTAPHRYYRHQSPYNVL